MRPRLLLVGHDGVASPSQREARISLAPAVSVAFERERVHLIGLAKHSTDVIIPHL